MDDTSSEFSDDVTLGEARAWLRDRAQAKGAVCPCCTQVAKVYKRSLNANMARILILIYRGHGQEWVHSSTTRDGTGDLAKLRWWGMVRESTERRADGGRAGWWQVTDRGVAFLRRRLRVPKYALIYDNNLLGHDGAEIGVIDALGTRFDYAALMAEGAGVAPDLTPEPAS